MGRRVPEELDMSWKIVPGETDIRVMTSLVVTSVCPNDGVTAGMITLVLMLLLPAPADEEGALVEEVLIGGDEHA